MLNPGSLKQALVEGAVRLPDLNMYEQGNGRINLPNSQKVLAEYSPRASIIPPAIDFTDCPYMWPYCTQPLYAFGLPVAFNATIVNGMAVTGSLVDPPVFKPTDEGGRLLHVNCQYSEVIWPWAGYLAIFVEVRAGWCVLNAGLRSPHSTPDAGLRSEYVRAGAAACTEALSVKLPNGCGCCCCSPGLVQGSAQLFGCS
jgi:hypothetical protein